MIAQIGNAFLIVFGLDAALSAVDEIQAFEPVSSLRAGFGATALLLTPVVFGLLAVSRELPARVFLPVLLTNIWVSLGAAPLVAWSGIEGLYLAASTIQLAIAAGGLLAVRFRSGSTGWVLQSDPTRPRDFPFLRFAAFASGTLLLGPPALGGYTLLAAGSYAHALTAGFLSFDLEGAKLAERVYEQRGREVRLIGMMHIGEDDEYDALFDSLEVEGTVVLEEGVSDENGLMDRKFSYANMARQLGLSQQGSISEHFAESDSEWPHLRHADIDAADFSKGTLELLQRVGEVWQAEGLAELIERASALSVRPEAVERARHELIDMRNQHLFTEIENGLHDYRSVAVPWGALHMPWIEEQIQGRGFRLTRSSEHPLLRWERVARAIF